MTLEILADTIRGLVAGKSDYVNAGPIRGNRCFFCDIELSYKAGEYNPHCTNPDCPAVKARKLLEGR